MTEEQEMLNKLYYKLDYHRSWVQHFKEQQQLFPEPRPGNVSKRRVKEILNGIQRHEQGIKEVHAQLTLLGAPLEKPVEVHYGYKFKNYNYGNILRGNEGIAIVTSS